MAVAIERCGIGAVVPAVVLAFTVGLVPDVTCQNPALNVAAFAIVCASVALKHYAQHVTTQRLQQRVAARREHMILEKIRRCQAQGFDEEATLRALEECDFDRAAAWELVLSDVCSDSS